MHRCLSLFVTIVIAAILFTGCGTCRYPARGPYLYLADVEATYGPLTVGNHPTQDRSGPGERIGLFQDAGGTVWGLPLTVASSGAVLVCAPLLLHDEKITDTYPANSTIIGSTNAPTGGRSDTGNLELALRDTHGTIRWQVAHGAHFANGEACWAAESPGPPQPLQYYRMAPNSSTVR